MRTFILVSFFACCFAGNAGAGGYLLKMTAVKGQVTYTHSQTNELGQPNNFVGKPKASGGRAREIIFNSTVRKDEKGALILDYQFELTGDTPGQPPFQSQASLALPPGKKVLAASAGGIRYYLEIAGQGAQPASTGNYQLSSTFIFGARSFSSKIAVREGTQCTLILVPQAGLRYNLSLLPAKADTNGEFQVQYSASIKEEASYLVEAKGEAQLAAGAHEKNVTTIKNSKLIMKATRF